MFLIHQGELEPMDIVLSSNGRIDNVTGATNPRLIWKTPSGTETTVELTAVSLSGGKFRRTWEEGETDIVGIHRGRVVLEMASGNDRTYPNTGAWFTWRITS